MPLVASRAGKRNVCAPCFCSQESVRHINAYDGVAMGSSRERLELGCFAGNCMGCTGMPGTVNLHRIVHTSWGGGGTRIYCAATDTATAPRSVQQDQRQNLQTLTVRFICCTELQSHALPLVLTTTSLASRLPEKKASSHSVTVTAGDSAHSLCMCKCHHQDIPRPFDHVGMAEACMQSAWGPCGVPFLQGAHRGMLTCRYWKGAGHGRDWCSASTRTVWP
jgi:hypothetical protein